jgi:hypothetical protein
METARTSETLVNFYQTTRRYNPKDGHLRFQNAELRSVQGCDRVRSVATITDTRVLFSDKGRSVSFLTIVSRPTGLSQLSRSAVLNLLTSADPHWITNGSRGTLSHLYDLNLKTIHKNTPSVHNKQIHKLRNILFNSQTKNIQKKSEF